MTPEQIEKLPKWAQQEVKTLIMHLDEANRELDRIKDNPPSNTIVGDGYDKSDTQYLRNNESITFRLEHGDLRLRIYEGEVNVNADSRTGYELCVRPNASNVVLLKFTPR